MAHLTVCLLRGRIQWLIRRGDPASVPIDHLPGWSLLNPLLPLASFFQHLPDDQGIGLEKDLYYLNTSTLYLSAEDRPPDEALLLNLPPLLQLLRSVSRQSTLPTDFVATLNTRIDALPDIDFPNRTSLNAAIRSDILDSALTMRVVQLAATRPIDFVAQVHDILLLDAIAAANSGDYRTAILYAAISVECLASTLLQEEHQRLLLHTPLPDFIRAIDIPVPEGTKRKDPIYHLLAQSNRFPILLHELPLYVLRRSLLVENKGLYDDAILLHETRNSLVHRGEISGERKPFPINGGGAIAALTCASAIFFWFGVRNTYHFPDSLPRRFGEFAS
jgi:hypothetical protein